MGVFLANGDAPLRCTATDCLVRGTAILASIILLLDIACTSIITWLACFVLCFWRFEHFVLYAAISFLQTQNGGLLMADLHNASNGNNTNNGSNCSSSLASPSLPDPIGKGCAGSIVSSLASDSDCSSSGYHKAPGSEREDHHVWNNYICIIGYCFSILCWLFKGQKRKTAKSHRMVLFGTLVLWLVED